jgi:dihydroorotase
MANTNPPCDNAEAASRVKARADALGLISLYPAVSLTEGMRGERLSPFLAAGNTDGGYRPPLLSEDGRDVADDALFLEAMRRAADLGCVVSCHCDEHGEDAATERAILLGKRAGCRVHIAHVSTRKAAESVRGDISVVAAAERGAAVTAEATPHHIALTKADAEKAGARTFGAVAPPLRSEADRLAVIEALRDGTIGVIAADHAPHTRSDKEGGAPGFSGLDTAFAVCNTVLVRENGFTPRKLFSLMSAMPARILGLSDRGLVAEGLRADIAVLDMDGERVIDPASFASRGRNTLFAGRRLRGEVVMTMRGGAVVYQAGCFRREAPRLTDITAM